MADDRYRRNVLYHAVFSGPLFAGAGGQVVDDPKKGQDSQYGVLRKTDD